MQTDDSLYRTIQMHFKESLSALAEAHAEWREYDDLYLAKHWSSQRASWRPDPVVNYVAYVVDQKSPQLTNNKPTGLILPRGVGDEEAARLFTQATEVITERIDFDDKTVEVVQTGLLLGTAWYKVYWDNSLTGGSSKLKTLWKGDVAIDTPDPSNMYHDPQANTVDECRYIIYAVPKTTQWVKEKFGQKVPPDQVFETEIYDRPSKNQTDGMVTFYEYWYRKDGKINCVYAAGGKVLKEIKEVYNHGRYPFVAFRPKKKRKSILGIGEPKNIVNNQKLLNKLIEMPTTNAMLTQNPIAIIDPTSGINASKWTNKPGQVWPAKNPKDAVHWLQPPPLSNDYYKLTDMLTTYIERMAGVYDSMTGETPKGVTAAAAIQMLVEQGSIPIKGISNNLYSAIKDVYELMIELIKENYTETRYLRIEDEGEYRFVEFNAAQHADLDYDVIVTAGASTPTSKAYIAQLASDLFDRGLLLGSEYLEMQEQLPNKERIVSRLKEIEAQQQGAPPTESATQQPETMVPPHPPPDLQTIYQQAPPELQQQIEMLLQQGMSEEQVLQTLMQMA